MDLFYKYSKLFIFIIIFCGLIFIKTNNSFAQVRFTPSPTPSLAPDPTISGCGNLAFCPSNTPTPTSIPEPTSAPASNPTSIPASNSNPISTPIPSPTPKPTLKPKVFIPIATFTPTLEPSITASPSPSKAPIAPITQEIKNNRSVFVASISGPNDIPLNIKELVLSAVIALGLVLLILFPAELFNSTLQSNYDEIIKWRIIKKSRKYYEKVNHAPAILLIIIFALLGGVVNSYLSTDFGFNKTTLILIIGMLMALGVNSIIYDATRSIYMKKRFGHESKLRAHSLGLFIGLILVTLSRFANFIPGYCYGIFTALVFKKDIKDKQNGEGLAFGAIALIVVALIGWFLWIPVKSLATSSNPSNLILIFDAAFACVWVSMLTSTVFGLIPIRFMYGETIKNWNKIIWVIIYFTGLFLFIYTLVHPSVVIYGTSDKTSWIAELSLFIGFGIFSFVFWGYFRYHRPLEEKIKKFRKKN